MITQNNIHDNPFYKKRFLDFSSTMFTVSLFLFTIAAGFAIAKVGMMMGFLLIFFPIIFMILRSIFKNPVFGYFVIFVINYFALGLTRYVPAPLGLTIDGLLVLTYASIFANNFYRKVDWTPAKTDLSFLAVIWYIYTLFQLVNPESASRVAWFYAMRGVSLYMLLTVPIVFMLVNKMKYIHLFLNLWAVFAMLGLLKGIQQLYLGPDPWEQAWLDRGGDVTHILFGKLRVFSFFSDAGQFGAHMGHTGSTFGIIGLLEKNKKRKILYLFVSFMALYGMMISGTRGAIAVPAGAGMLFLILSKNLKIIIPGALLGLTLLFFFKFTTIGNQNYEIRRMRSGFDKDNPSLQVRLENQRKLKAYMATRPFGGGIGSAGNWGQRFSPGTFLAETPTDSWYVMIWAEQGIVGLYLHLFILFYVIIKSSYIIMTKLKDPEIKAIMSGLASGILGIMLASYGNGVLGQMPTGIILYSSMAFIFMSPALEKSKLAEKMIN